MKRSIQQLSELAAHHLGPDGRALTQEEERELTQLRAAIESHAQEAERRLAGKSDEAVVAE